MHATMVIIKEGGAMAMSEVTNNVESVRSSHGLTQEQVADILGVSRATYISVAKGRRDLTTGELENHGKCVGMESISTIA